MGFGLGGSDDDIGHGCGINTLLLFFLFFIFYHDNFWSVNLLFM